MQINLVNSYRFPSQNVKVIDDSGKLLDIQDQISAEVKELLVASKEC